MSERTNRSLDSVLLIYMAAKEELQAWPAGWHGDLCRGWHDGVCQALACRLSLEELAELYRVHHLDIEPYSEDPTPDTEDYWYGHSHGFLVGRRAIIQAQPDYLTASFHRPS